MSVIIIAGVKLLSLLLLVLQNNGQMLYNSHILRDPLFEIKPGYYWYTRFRNQVNHSSDSQSYFLNIK